MKTLTFSGDGIAQFSDCLSNALAGDFSPTLAIVFASVQQDFPQLVGMLKSRGIKVVGASSAGEIEMGKALEFCFSVMLLDIDPAKMDIFSQKTDEQGTFEASRALRLQAEERFSNPGLILLSAGLMTNGDEIVRGMKEGFSKGITLYGGLAGDDLKMADTFVFTHDDLMNDGLVCLALDGDRISMGGMASSGWEAVGVEKTVTRSEGNVVYTIDKEPAYNVFKKYFGLPQEMQARWDVAKMLGAQYPLQVMREEGGPVLRAPLIGNPDDGSIIFAGSISQGSKVKFSISPGFQVADQAVIEMEKLKEKFPEADALLLFSCKARHLALGPLVDSEISGMQEKWQVPLAGFFTYGEFGHFDSDVCEFHNEICSLVVLKDRVDGR